MSTSRLGARSPPAQSPSLADHSGWLWKRSMGTSLFGRTNWRRRYFKATSTELRYFENETSDKPRKVFLWSNVTHLYDTVGPGVDKDASETSKFYFGIRVFVGQDEHLLLLRTDTALERQNWINVFHKLFDSNERLLQDDEDDDDEDTSQQVTRGYRRNAAPRGTFMEAISTKLRTLVSRKKQRLVEGGYDLDFAYITDDLIAMGFPAEGREAMYRNSMDDVIRYFDEHHPKAFKIYNLCSERSYPPSRFDGRFARYPFDDHNPCPLLMLDSLCQDVDAFLKSGPKNVVSIHCKAGKGRTGLMICACMLYRGQVMTAEAALREYGRKRTKDGKGVQIPSQRRYLHYFERYLHEFSKNIAVVPTRITAITLITTPHFDPDGGCDPYIIIEQRRANHKHVPCGTKEGNMSNAMECVYDSRKFVPVPNMRKADKLAIYISAVVVGDVRITVWDQDSLSKDDRMFAFWIHTAMLPLDGTLTIKKEELDYAVKDKKCQLFDANFACTIDYTFESGSSSRAVLSTPTSANSIPPSAFGGQTGAAAAPVVAVKAPLVIRQPDPAVKLSPREVNKASAPDTITMADSFVLPPASAPKQQTPPPRLDLRKEDIEEL